MLSSVLVHRQRLVCSGHLVGLDIQLNIYLLFPFSVKMIHQTYKVITLNVMTQ